MTVFGSSMYPYLLVFLLISITERCCYTLQPWLRTRLPFLSAVSIFLRVLFRAVTRCPHGRDCRSPWRFDPF